jgi:hypothetical protein
MDYKLGKTPARKNSASFRLRDYLSLAILPVPPVSGGHFELADDGQMFGNDTIGCCTCADVGHATLLWNREADKQVNISTENVLALYSAVTGYNGDPSTDTGADMSDVAKYHRRVGLSDESGKYHKIVAYMAVTPGNTEELKQSIYLFGACSIGWGLPLSAQEQTEEGEPWSIVNRSPIVGGHDTLAVGYDQKYIYVVTWGQLQKVTYPFFAKFMDEGLVKLSLEMLENGKSMEGFNATQLQKDLGAL